jgi:hypothetical protein
MAVTDIWLERLLKDMSHSYKPIVILAIIDGCADLETGLKNQSLSHPQFISKEKIVQRVSKFFWKIEENFRLEHGPTKNNIHEKIKDCIEKQKRLEQNSTQINNSKPWGTRKKWNNVWRIMEEKPSSGTSTSTVEKIWKTLRDQPLKHFQGTKHKNVLYSYSVQGIEIPQDSFSSLIHNKKLLRFVATSRLASFLETMNPAAPRIFQKIEFGIGTKTRTIPKWMKKILTKYHSPIECYICGDTIPGTPDWDHVIPFSFIGTNDLWNLMPSCGPSSGTQDNCNQVKSDSKPEDDQVKRAQKRNEEMLNEIKKQNLVCKAEWLEMAEKELNHSINRHSLDTFFQLMA